MQKADDRRTYRPLRLAVGHQDHISDHNVLIMLRCVAQLRPTLKTATRLKRIVQLSLITE